jgi:hypothetical protein
VAGIARAVNLFVAGDVSGGRATFALTAPLPPYIRESGRRPFCMRIETIVRATMLASCVVTSACAGRVGQMIHVLVLGDYTNTYDPSFAELLHWIRDDGVGGVESQ